MTRSFKYSKYLSFPRLTGSKGELNAESFISNFLKSEGYNVREEYFNIFLTPWVVLKSGTSIGLVFLILSMAIHKTHPLIAAGFSLLLPLIAIFSDRIWYAIARKKTFPSFLKSFKSKNIIGRLNNDIADKTKPELFLIAHYDSKSQNLSLPVRIIFSSLLILSCIILSNHYIASAINSGYPTFLMNLYFSIAAICLIFFLFLKTENKSCGALDNSGSLGVLLELASQIKENFPNNISVSFLFTGAEELGLIGSFAFLSSHHKELKVKDSFFLNLDGIGIHGKLRILSGRSFLFPASRKKLYFTVNKIAKDLGIKIAPFIILPGLMMDHIPFLNLGLDSISLCCVSKKSMMIHTKKDTSELLEEKGLEEVLNLIKSLIKELDLQYGLI